ncbi:MAG TPA: hypothetical protein VD993_17700 [Chitinophagaceae bacterium]|nr:hypothetical protein [Chitinophagaceae bacterium]
MMQIRRFCTVLLFLVIIGIHPSGAQSQRGKIIYVHPAQVVKLKFRSAVDNYSFVNKEESRLFNIKLANSRTFLINSLAQPARSSNLVITEGENTHLFILVYKGNLNADTELVYDFSNRNKSSTTSPNTTAALKQTPQPGGSLSTQDSRKAKTALPAEEPPATSTDNVTYSVTPANSKPPVQTAESNNEATTVQKNITAANNVATTDYTSKPVENVQLTPKQEKTTTADVKTASYATTQSMELYVPDAAAIDSMRYEHFIHLGDSIAWIAKDYKAALKWYDSALHIKPQAAFPKRQIRAVTQLHLERETLAADRLRKARFDSALQHYKKAEALRVQQQFAPAYNEYKQFLSRIDTTSLAAYKSSELYYINQSKDYLLRLQHYLPKPVVKAPPPPVPDDTPRKKGKKKRRG